MSGATTNGGSDSHARLRSCRSAVSIRMRRASTWTANACPAGG